MALSRRLLRPSGSQRRAFNRATPFRRKFAPAYAKGLVRIAGEDLRSADILHTQGARKENCVFMVQQTVEKSLKAVICHLGLAIPMIHDIAGHLASLPDSVTRPPNEEALNALTEFATIRRYEEGFEEISEQDLSKAIEAGRAVLEWAKQIIK